MFGTATTASATKVMLLGSGELGKEVAIECQRLGLEVIAVDRYENAPAMHVAHRSHVVNMLDGAALERIITQEKPDYVVPEIEAIATDTLVALEAKGLNVVPCAKATQITMDRAGIRRLVAETLSLRTSAYRFCHSLDDLQQAVSDISLPCIVKPIMSSSGKGQSILRDQADIEKAWHYAQEAGRAESNYVIVEGFVDFDYEITLLTVQAVDGIHFCNPIGHRQEDGDYRESWQPQAMSEVALQKAHHIAEKVVSALGGYGVFGVELFIKGDDVIFNEVSPRPHDTGMVTLISQPLSEFALHVRAFTGLPIHSIKQYYPAASAVIMANGTSNQMSFSGVDDALHDPNAQIRLFGKPDIDGTRRLGVALAQADDVDQAVKSAIVAASKVKVHF